MIDIAARSFPLTLVGLILVLCATLPALVDLVGVLLRRRKYVSTREIYEDEDGTATTETQRSTVCRLQTCLLLATAGFGTTLAVALAILGQMSKAQVAVTPWLQVGIWILITVQATSIGLKRDTRKRFGMALANAASYVISFFTICIANDFFMADRLRKAFLIIHLPAFFIGFALCLTLPRRPTVYHNGHVVDEQYAASAFNLITFSWCAPLLAIAVSKGRLEIEDLPVLGHSIRAKYLHDSFQPYQSKGLLRALVSQYSSELIKQHILTALHALLQILPSVVIYNLLRLVEARDAGASFPALAAAAWVVVLGLAIITQSICENWFWWLGHGRISIPARVQLSALIFAKSMRRKDLKGATQHSPKGSLEDDGSSEGSSAKSFAKEIEEVTEKTRQGTINLVGVDAKRVSDFCVLQNYILGAMLRLIVAFSFLGSLIGWQPLLAGISVLFLASPLNYCASKGYTRAQNQLMAARDRKLSVLNECLAGVRQIKLGALEERWHSKLMDIREQELQAQWKAFAYDVFLIFCWLFGPVMLSASALAVYAIIHGSLGASVAFTTISVLGQIQGTLGSVPGLITVGVDAWVSLKRIHEYLRAPENPVVAIPGDTVTFEKATIAWPSDDTRIEGRFTLDDLTITFPKNELSVVSGKTGSGKSLLLAAILGEVDLIRGKITVPFPPSPTDRYSGAAGEDSWIIPSALAFVSQQPWIENCSFRDNVLFGSPYRKRRYCKVLTACALDKDLEILPDGDMTEIGANGINLSGGQRWRIILARALYSRAGILVLDDIFSAVDAHVARHIYSQAITGELAQGRTRILVTHHVSLCLPKTRYSVLLADGKVEFAGFVEEFEQTGALQGLLDQDTEEAISGEAAPESFPDSMIKTAEEVNGDYERSQRSLTDGNKHLRSKGILNERRLSVSSVSNSLVDEDLSMPTNAPRKFVEEETRETGRVALSVYIHYLKATGSKWLWLGILGAYISYLSLVLARSWWVAIWTESYNTKITSRHGSIGAYISQFAMEVYSFQYASIDTNLRFYLIGYFSISGALCVAASLRALAIYVGSITASRKLYDGLIRAVLRAPLRWLETVPLGRLLNRFTADLAMVDSDIGAAAELGSEMGLQLVAIIIAGAIVSPYIIFFAAILLVVCGRYSIYYFQGAREMKRLESLARSPILDCFGAALSGVDTIRSFERTEAYIMNMFSRIDTHGVTLFYTWLFSRWFMFRAAVVGACFSVAMAALIVSIRSIDAAFAGFALSFMLDYSSKVIWLLRQVATIELGMNATERILEYSHIATEDSDGADAPAAWPTEGRLEVRNVVVGYAPDLPPVLNGVTFGVNPRERVGIVGRTGAGKSSLTLALFRFLEARQGSIHIDGLDISKIKLEHLRSRLAIIPQDPVLFSGTVRSNLDPFDEHDDPELREALGRVHLVASEASEASATDSSTTAQTPKDASLNPFASLSSPISSGGHNLSQGQRQLLCLARAIIARPRILILDEATSAVDRATDALIQQSIREQFVDCTLLVIAHRLATIKDFDRVLVMGEGKVLEFGTPRELLKGGGVFAGLVEESGEAKELREAIL